MKKLNLTLCVLGLCSLALLGCSGEENDCLITKDGGCGGPNYICETDSECPNGMVCGPAGNEWSSTKSRPAGCKMPDKKSDMGQGGSE